MDAGDTILVEFGFSAMIRNGEPVARASSCPSTSSRASGRILTASGLNGPLSIGLSAFMIPSNPTMHRWYRNGYILYSFDMALPRRSLTQHRGVVPGGMPVPQVPQSPVQSQVPEQGMNLPGNNMNESNSAPGYGQQPVMQMPQMESQSPQPVMPAMQAGYPDTGNIDFSQQDFDLPQGDQLLDDSSWDQPQQQAQQYPVRGQSSQPRQAAPAMSRQVQGMSRPVQGLPYMGGQPAQSPTVSQQVDPTVQYSQQPAGVGSPAGYDDNPDLVGPMDPLASSGLDPAGMNGQVSQSDYQQPVDQSVDYSEYVEPAPQQQLQPVASNAPDDADWERQMNDAARSSIDQKARTAEERAVENMEKREARDIRSVRRSRKSSLQPNAAVDALKKAKTIRTITVFLVMTILALAVFNVLVPKKQYSITDIQSIARSASGDTGFPLQEGAGIAQQFIQAYIQSGSASDQLLSVFYNGMTMSSVTNGDGTTGSQSNSISNPANIEQDIQYGPYVYEEQAVATDGSSATYKVGALVYRKNTIDGSIITSSDGKTPLYRWLFYQVDVYYDKDKEMFTVSSDSPTLVAEPRMSQGNAAPDADLPGDKEEKDDLENDSMQSLVTQFFTAWSKSDDTALSVLIDHKESKPSVNFNKSNNVGLGGAVELAGDPSYKIYGPPASDKYYRALVTVQWKETINENSSYTQTSKYVLKLKKSGTGSESKFYVIDVQPYLYMPAPKTNN